MIQAGLQILDREGLDLGAESISYVNVFAYLNTEYAVSITRGSVHERIWATHGHYRREVLAEAVKYFMPAPVASSEVAAALAQAFEEAGPNLDRGDLFTTFARKVGPKLLNTILDSTVMGQIHAAKAIASRVDDVATTDPLREAIDQRAKNELTVRQGRLRPLVAWLGFRARTKLGLTDEDASRLFIVASMCLLEGAYLDYHAGSQDIAKPVAFLGRRADAEEPWLIASIGVKAVFEFLYEVDPGADTGGTAMAPGMAAAEPLPQVQDGTERPDDRRSRQQLKQLVLTAGAELLMQHGLELKAESLTYGAVFDQIKQTEGAVVSQSSVHHRIWANQEQYRVEVLTRAVEVNPGPNSEVVEAFDLGLPATGPVSTIHRQQVAADIIRRTTQAQTNKVSPRYRSRLLTKAGLLLLPETEATEPLRTAMNRSDRDRAELYRHGVRTKIMSLGFEVRPELEITQTQALGIFQTLAMTTATGAIFDYLAGLTVITHPYQMDRLDGTTDTNPWTPSGIATLAYFHQLFQPTPAP